jgi:hypothetical protein
MQPSNAILELHARLERAAGNNPLHQHLCALLQLANERAHGVEGADKSLSNLWKEIGRAASEADQRQLLERNAEGQTPFQVCARVRAAMVEFGIAKERSWDADDDEPAYDDPYALDSGETFRTLWYDIIMQLFAENFG